MIKRNKIFSKLILGIFLTTSIGIAAPQSVSAASSRLGGTDRYETAVKVSQNGWTTSDYVILASGQGYADALCAAPIAKKYNAPILLTQSDTLTPEVKDEIVRLKASHVIEIGGNASISADIEKQLKDMSLDVQRLGGQDRYATSAAAAKALENVQNVIITSGLGYADALSIAPIAASQGMPILLTSQNSIPDSVQNYINSNKATIKNSYIVGGNGVISDSSVKNLPSASRISGSDRFDTNVKVMDAFKSSIKFDNLYIVKGNGPTGKEFADALSASALAAKTSSPVVLTYNGLSQGTQDFVKSNVPKTANVVAVGGQASVADSLMSSMQQIINPTQSSGGNVSSEEIATLKSVLSKIKTIDTSKLNDKQKEVLSDTISTIDKYVSNTNYDYSKDVQNIKALSSGLSSADKLTLQTDIFNSGVTISEALNLKNQFGL